MRYTQPHTLVFLGMANFSGTFAIQLKLEERGADQASFYLFISPAGMTGDGRIARSMAGVPVKNVDWVTNHPIIAEYRRQLEEEWPRRTSWSAHFDSPSLWRVTGSCNVIDKFGNPGDAVVVEQLTPLS